MSRRLIFVDGELYKGAAVFNCYRGLGSWDNTRPVSVKLEVPTCSDVLLIDTEYGKARKLVLPQRKYSTEERNGEKAIDWDVFTLAQDE